MSLYKSFKLLSQSNHAFISAKRGVDISDRLLLGYHSSPFTMGLTYSCDAMARSMQVLNNMLSETSWFVFS